ncbi:hypothetical protein [Propioniciclava soli]|uniref:hypothetical protein n=1 Tax=Propioniciclava soli TaxID=2775081 RepID=UPI001E3773B5|nr:hypothetical protein [Propioniciclava soli]
MARQRWTVVAAALATVTLSGCALTGTVHVDAERLDVDVTFAQFPGPSCVGGPEALVFERVGSEPGTGTSTCRLHGTIDRAGAAEDEAQFLSILAPVTERALLFLIPSTYIGLPGNDNLTAIDLTVTFAGDVETVSAGGTASGPVAHITDAAAVRAQGVTVVAARQPRLPITLMAGGIGLAAGLLIAWASLVVHRRRVARPDPPDADGGPLAPLPGPVQDRPVDAPPPEDPDVWRPGP